MSSFNRIEILGYAGNVEAKKTNAGKDYLKFGICATERWKDKQGEWQERSTWFNCVLWRLPSTLLQKGEKCFVEGRMESRVHDEKTYWDVNVQRLIPLGSGKPLARQESTEQKTGELDF